MSSEQLQEAIDLIQSEKIDEAREILLPLVKEPYPFADSWFMLMYCMPTTRQKVWCLQECLRIKPTHEDALRMLDYYDPNHEFYKGEILSDGKEDQDKKNNEEEPISWVVVAATVGSVLALTALFIFLVS